MTTTGTTTDCSGTQTCSNRCRYGFSTHEDLLPAAFTPYSRTSVLLQLPGSTKNTSIRSIDDTPGRNTSCLLVSQELNKLRVDQRPSRASSSPAAAASSSCQQEAREFFSCRIQQQEIKATWSWSRMIQPLFILLVFLCSDICVKAASANGSSSNSNRYSTSRSEPAASHRFLAETTATTTTNSTTINVVSVDQILQQAAFRAFEPRQKLPEYTPHSLTVPGNLSGVVTAQAVRLVRHSIKVRGVSFNEFLIPSGAQLLARVKRLIIVHENFGSLSSTLFHLASGQELATPVLSMAVYDASNLTSTNPTQYSIITTSATAHNITVTFASTASTAQLVAAGLSPVCMSFSSSTGNATNTGTVPTGKGPYVCSLKQLVPVALVGPAAALAPVPAPAPAPSSTGAPAPAPAPVSGKKSSSNTWKIVLGTVLGGVGGLALLGLLAFLAYRYNEKRRLDRLHRLSESGETLQQSPLGQSRAPVAGSLRTRPTLEKLE